MLGSYHVLIYNSGHYRCFICHRIDSGHDNVDIHSIWIISWLLVISLLISWASCVSSSINLSEFVQGILLLSHRFVWSIVESLDIVSMYPVEFDGDGVPSFLGSGITKSVGFLVGI